MKISIIVEHNIESVKKELEDSAKMIDDLSERYPSIINGDDVEVTFTV